MTQWNGHCSSLYSQVFYLNPAADNHCQLPKYRDTQQLAMHSSGGSSGSRQSLQCKFKDKPRPSHSVETNVCPCSIAVIVTSFLLNSDHLWHLEVTVNFNSRAHLHCENAVSVPHAPSACARMCSHLLLVLVRVITCLCNVGLKSKR